MAKTEVVIVIGTDGVCRMVYDEKFVLSGRNPVISRLSDVEPTSSGEWQVHFRHRTAPEKQLFPYRSDAVAYEIEQANKMLEEGEI